MKRRIYYHDTDAGGVVYYANYLKYMEEARLDLFHEYGLSETSLNGIKVFFPVAKCSIAYHKPAYYGDTIECTADILKISPARIVFLQRVTHAQKHELLAEAEITLACVSAENFKPLKIPADVQACFQKI